MSDFKIIARSSPLSMIQADEVFSKLPELKYSLETIDSYGDKHKDISLMENIPPDFFTRELDEKILSGEADIAIHSAKDLPYPLTPGVEVFALTAAEDKTDALVSHNNLKLSELPAGAKIGTSSAARKAELLAVRPDLTVVSIRGCISERIALLDSGSIDALIVATCALKRLGQEHRIAQILPFKTHPLQGNLAITGRKADATAKALFNEIDIRRRYGKVTLAGFGPGNPDLLTFAADTALTAAEAIFYDALTDSEFLDRYKGEKIFVGKRKGKHSHSQDEINEMLYQSALAGKNTVRLKGGDPMIFAHGREEIDYLQSRLVEVAVIPGITTAIAFAAESHIPLTHRGVAASVAFITGHSPDNIQTPDADTLVYYMAGSNLSAIARKLLAAGRAPETPVALAFNVSLPDAKTFFSTLHNLRHSNLVYPTPLLMVVGDVVNLTGRLNLTGFQNLLGLKTTDTDANLNKVPNLVKVSQQNLSGSVSLETGTGTATNLTGLQDLLGLKTTTHTPLIKLYKSQTPPAAVAAALIAADYIVFTSRHGVSFFFDFLKDNKTDLRRLSDKQVIAVGAVTAQVLADLHIYPDYVSETESAEGIIRYFTDNHIKNKTVLLPRSDIGLKSFSNALQSLGNEVIDLTVYNNIINEEAEKQDLNRFDEIHFTSPSGVNAFLALYGSLPEGIVLTAKGLTTENKLKEKIYEQQTDALEGT